MKLLKTLKGNTMLVFYFQLRYTDEENTYPRYTHTHIQTPMLENYSFIFSQL